MLHRGMVAGCGTADSQERERCKDEMKRHDKVEEWEGSNRPDGWLV